MPAFQKDFSAQLEGSRIIAEVFLVERFNLMAKVYSKQFCCDSKNIYPCRAFPEEHAGLLIHMSQELKKSWEGKLVKCYHRDFPLNTG